MSLPKAAKNGDRGLEEEETTGWDGGEAAGGAADEHIWTRAKRAAGED